MKTRIALLAALVLFLPANAVAQTAVFIVRHAERADTAAGGTPMMAADPNLSAAGRVRARSLATTLKDAGITAIFATEFKRTQQTAAPLAKALGLTVVTIAAADSAGLVAKIKASPGNVLVVSHSTRAPEVIKGLGVDTPPAVAESEFDNLFIVTRGEKPALLRLHYR
jgi:phosphohistidine phosphatase SixA